MSVYDDSQNQSRLSRRKFMMAAGLGAAGATAPGLALGTVTLGAGNAYDWDEETDVVVVGSGGAGLSGAIGALDQGAAVSVLEKGPVVGGTTAKSGAGFWIPDNHLMPGAGLSDNRDDFLKYCARVSFPELYRSNESRYGLMDINYRLFDTFYKEGKRVVKTLQDTGALASALDIGWEGKPAPDYHGQLEENAGIVGRQMMTVNADGSRAPGAGMIQQMSQYVRNKGGKILTDTRVTKIVKDDTGRVVGVHTESWNGSMKVRARKGVIFGSGGFTHNKEMRSNFLRTPVMGGCAVPTNEGDLIYMASELGVKFGNLNEAWNQQEILEEVVKFSSVPSGVFFLGGDSMVAVNRFGQRMYDEKYVYPERTRSHQVYDQFLGNYPNLYQVMVFDEKAREFGGSLIPEPGTNLPSHVIQGDTLEQLAQRIDERFASLEEHIGPYSLDSNFVSGLKDTIERFNGFAQTGVDKDFHRGEAPIDSHFHYVPVDRGYPNRYMAPIADSGPYYAVLLAAGTLDTKGGPMFNEKAQVLNIQDEPIPGFYVAGNCAASPSGKSYLGGGATLGLGMTFGYLAGEHAAQEAGA